MGQIIKSLAAVCLITTTDRHYSDFIICPILQGVSIASYAEPCTSHRWNVCPSILLSVCHMLAPSENDASYYHYYFPVLLCLSVSVTWLAVKTASEMTYSVSGGALNSAHSLLSRNLHGRMRKNSSFRDKKLKHKFDTRRARALNKSGVGKIRNFQPISRRISETVQDRTKVTIND